MSTKSTSSSSSSSSHAGFDCINLLPNVTSLSKPHKRWRFAFTVIYSSRVLISLAKQIISAKTKNPFFTGLSRSPSYTAINIHPNINEDTADNDQDVSFFNDNNGKNLLIDTVKEKNMEFLNKFGGVQGVVCALQTDVDNGVCGGDLDISHRRDVFGSHTYQKPSLKGFLNFVLETFRDTIILILLACAALSIGFGIKENGVKEGWYDGGSIFIAVFLVVGVSAVSNFRQSRQFNKLSSVSNNIQVDAVRDGRRQNISIFDIVVGDVVCLKIGDQIPADGLFLNGYSLQVDESRMTGETDPVEIDGSKNPFLLSGCKVVDGFASMIVTSVGMNNHI